VVVEPDKAAETPLGMTPWSASGQGHDCDEAEGGEPEAQDSPAPPASAEEVYAAMSAEDKTAMRKDFEGKDLIRPGEFLAILLDGAPDPLLREITRRWEERESRKRAQAAGLESAGEQELPPGSIQACQGRGARMAAGGSVGAFSKSAIRGAP